MAELLHSIRVVRQRYRELHLTRWLLVDMVVIIQTHIKDGYFGNPFTITLMWMPQDFTDDVNATKLPRWLINIGSGNCLVLPGTKPLPEPRLTKLCDVIWDHSATVYLWHRLGWSTFAIMQRTVFNPITHRYGTCNFTNDHIYIYMFI